MTEKLPTIFLKGTAASPGIAGGRVYYLETGKFRLPQHSLGAEEVEAELAAFRRALEKTEGQLEELKERVEKKLDADQAAIFGAHQLVLSDPALVEEVEARIRRGVNGAQAIAAVVEELVEMLAQLEDEYLRERAADIQDVGNRILGNFLGVSPTSLADIGEPVILLAPDLTPSETVQLEPGRVLAFATAAGGRTSHAAIMARSLGIPAVVGLGEGAVTDLAQAQEVIVDGNGGEVILNPREKDWAQLREKEKEYRAHQHQLAFLRELPAQTPDGRRVRLLANIGSPADLGPVQRANAEGIGLFRTEFLYLDRDSAPTEEEQFEVYKEVLETMAPHPVTIRSLDIGGDKDVPYLGLPAEMNPFLGWRAIRYCLDRPEIFQSQLRAILRASAHGKAQLMLPLISNVEEVRRARALLQEVRMDLDRRNIPYDPRMEVGIMIETPGAALMADILAQEVDFFSIGTNDLIQYSLAVDRGNERVSHLFQTFHPGVLRLVQQVIAAGQAAGIKVAMCGEMAGEVRAVPILLGLGLDEFSMGAGSLLTVKGIIRSLPYHKAQELASQALDLGTGDEITAFLEESIGDLELG